MNRSANDAVVVGTGLMTSVGLSALETAASVRSATARFSESSICDKRFEPFILAEVPEDGLPPLAEGLASDLSLTAREIRMLRLATMPMLECLKPLAEAEEVFPLLIALPDHETQLELDRDAFPERLAQQAEITCNLPGSSGQFRGRAGGLQAMNQALQSISQGQTDLIVVGGVDTFRDLYVLGQLDDAQRVQSTSNMDGFVPGEGAGFLLIARRQKAEQLQLPPLATLSAAAEGFEEGHLYSEKPYKGEGLATCLEGLFSDDPPASELREVYSSMNGENHWAKEWGVAFTRHRDAFDEEHGLHHPADCFGDTGAACGPALSVLATLGVTQRYRTPPCLVYCSSDGGDRAAVVLEAC